jgi:hypothetical protein
MSKRAKERATHFTRDRIARDDKGIREEVPGLRGADRSERDIKGDGRVIRRGETKKKRDETRSVRERKRGLLVLRVV